MYQLSVSHLHFLGPVTFFGHPSTINVTINQCARLSTFYDCETEMIQMYKCTRIKANKTGENSTLKLRETFNLFLLKIAFFVDKRTYGIVSAFVVTVYSAADNYNYYSFIVNSIGSNVLLAKHNCTKTKNHIVR